MVSKYRMEGDYIAYGMLGVVIGIALYKLYWYILGEIDYDIAAKDGPEEEVSLNDIKMVLVVRNDLKMGKGKIGAQCGHATLGAYKSAWRKKAVYWHKWLDHWDKYGSTKVCVKVNTEEELVYVYKLTRKANIPSYLVVDAGRTQIAAHSKTVVGIGPVPAELIDPITGSLKLL